MKHLIAAAIVMITGCSSSPVIEYLPLQTEPNGGSSPDYLSGIYNLTLTKHCAAIGGTDILTVSLNSGNAVETLSSLGGECTNGTISSSASDNQSAMWHCNITELNNNKVNLEIEATFTSTGCTGSY